VCEQTLPLSLWLSFELEERDRGDIVKCCVRGARRIPVNINS
jgi:hypothetical protein